MSHTLPSCPGSARASTPSRRGSQDVDGRVEPGHDDKGGFGLLSLTRKQR